MKYFNILLALCYIPTSIIGFGMITKDKTRNYKLTTMSNDGTINEVLKYKDVLSANTYNTLISRIKAHDIKKIYVTNKLDAVIAKDASEQDIITDYSITKINPFVVSSIVDESNKNNVETYFLEQPQISGFEVIAQNVFGLFGSLTIM
jgi:hypothetical protein